MRRSLLFWHRLAKCSLCTSTKTHVQLQRTFSTSMTRRLKPDHTVHSSSYSCNLSLWHFHPCQKKIHIEDNVHLKQQRFYCTKDFDFKDDPETKSLLNEIISDFEGVKKSQEENQTQSEQSNVKKKNYSKENSKEENQSKEEPNLNYQPLHSDIENVEDFEEDAVDPAWIPPISLKRGNRGVFELDELVTFLEKENGQNIAVVDIPPEARFGEHMVIVSALSVRHLRSMSSRVKWTHKQKKGNKDDSLKVEGFDTAPDWHAMDLGNIILHLFLPETRELYDLETLWTNWGKPGQVEKEIDPYTVSPENDFWNRLEPQHAKDDKRDPK